MKSVDEQVIEIVARAALIPSGKVTPEATLSELGIGSIEQIECVLALEERFRVELDESSLWRLRTVQDVMDTIKRALAVNA